MVLLNFMTRVPSPLPLLLSRIWSVKVTKATMSSFPTFVPVHEEKDTLLSLSSTEVKRTGPLMRVVSYNILAQAYVKSSLFPHSPSSCLKWSARSKATLSLLKRLGADFLCLQEMDEYENFYKKNLESDGYSSIYVQRSGRKRDGCAIFYRTNRARLVMMEKIDYNDLANLINPSPDTLSSPALVNPLGSLSGPTTSDVSDPYVRLKRDCVGILAAFMLDDPVQQLIILANTHLYWDPDWADVKLAQAKFLSFRLAQFEAHVSSEYECRPSILVAGDFNSIPGDEVYKYLLSGPDAAGKPLHLTTLLDLPDKNPIRFNSLYALTGEEPPFTNYTPEFTGTLDYIFFSNPEQLKPLYILQLPGHDSLDLDEGLPNHHYPSDHLPIGGDFRVQRSLS